jgi:ATP-dependent exoDNAse (exonuclease V) alpha subunit
MNKIEWEKLTTPEIKLKKISLEREYDSIKNEINKLLSKLSDLDEEYIRADKELQKRNGR